VQYPVPIEFVGVHDRFGQSGTPQQLIEKYGLGVHSIIEAVLTVIERKK
jgi:transketolase